MTVSKRANSSCLERACTNVYVPTLFFFQIRVNRSSTDDDRKLYDERGRSLFVADEKRVSVAVETRRNRSFADEISLSSTDQLQN